MRRSGLGDTELAALAQANRERSDEDERGPSAPRRFDDELRTRIARNPPQQQNSSNFVRGTAYTSSARESTSGFSTITAVPHHTSFQQQQQQQQSAARVEAAEEVEDLPMSIR